jgi:hypothetical protein
MEHAGVVDAFEFAETRTDATLQAALDTIGARPITLLLPYDGDGLWTLNLPHTFPANLLLWIPAGVYLTGSGHLTIDCQVVAHTDNWYLGTGGLSGQYRTSTIGALEVQRLGVNTNNPQAPLHVLGGGLQALDAILRLEDGFGTATAYVAFYNAGVQYGALGLPGGVNDIALALSNSARFAVVGGPMGIGINTPQARLRVAGDAALPAIIRVEDALGTHVAHIDFFNAGLQYGALGLAGGTNDVRLVLSNGANFALMGGPMGIGTFPPQAQLHVFGPAGNITGVRIEEPVPNEGAVVNFVSAGVSRALFGLHGTQHVALEIAGTSKFIVNGNGVGFGGVPGAFYFEVFSSQCAMPGGGPWLNSSSDARLKQNISLFTDGLNVALRLTPKWYEYNGLGGMPKDGRRYVGFVAQDVLEVAPYMVGVDPDRKLHPEDAATTEVYTMHEAALPHILLNAIQEQQRLIDTQTVQIAALLALVTALEADRVGAEAGAGWPNPLLRNCFLRFCTRKSAPFCAPMPSAVN